MSQKFYLIDDDDKYSLYMIGLLSELDAKIAAAQSVIAAAEREAAAYMAARQQIKMGLDKLQQINAKQSENQASEYC